MLMTVYIKERYKLFNQMAVEDERDHSQEKSRLFLHVWFMARMWIEWQLEFPLWQNYPARVHTHDGEIILWWV